MRAQRGERHQQARGRGYRSDQLLLVHEQKLIGRAGVRVLRVRYLRSVTTDAMANPQVFSVRPQQTSAGVRSLCHRPLVTLAAVTCAVAIAACGSSSNTSKSVHHDALVVYSGCMRSHGVPNFPDPSPSGGIHLSSALNPSSPAFKAAQASCQKLLPGGGPGAAHPTARAKAQTLKISECMRQHGVSGFPDPTLTPPSNPAGYSILEDRGGVVLAVPSTIDPASPLFKQAADTCGFR
jgi:hypothetical protein